MRKAVREVHVKYLSWGFEYEGLNGSGHHSYLWPATGEVIELPSTPSAPGFQEAAVRRARKVAHFADTRTKRRSKR